jgi:hypothetical protein
MKHITKLFKISLLIALLTWGLNPVFATVTSFPYFQGFETTCLGSWTQNTDDNINWTRRSGSTPSSSTGPSSAAEGSYYYYIEASGSNYPSKTAILTTDWINASALSNPNFTFSYNMYGSNMGSLYLEISTNGSTWNTLWSKSGNQGTSWGATTVGLISFKSVPFQLRFRGVTGNGFRSDMAIDKISISNGFYSGGGDDPACGSSNGPCTNTVSSFPYNESFEFGTGLWTTSSSGGSTIPWTRRSGSTSSSSTGPSSAYHGLFYMYTEASGNFNETATIVSPCIDASNLNNPYIYWKYHMYGSAMGTLYLELSTNGTTWNTIWSKSGNQGNSWESKLASLGNFNGVPFQLRFRGVTGSSYTSDMAIDDIEIRDGVVFKNAAENLQNETSSLLLYPNPASNHLTLEIDMEESATAKLKVYNYTGQVQLERDIYLNTGRNEVSLDLNLAQGAYLMRVETGDKVQTKKFSIVR